jgi:acyl transferase domain-containing protein/acyl carrier protein
MSGPTGDNQYRALLTDAVQTIEKLQTRIAALERERTEPVAIVGMACRLPGGCDTPEAFWDLLARGGDAITEVPPDRWDAEEYYDPDPDAPGRAYSRWGGFLDRVAEFDAPFFGISRREALSLDPQQRLLLEVSWEALERAGQAPDKLLGSAAGVFVGISGSEYADLIKGAAGETRDIYGTTGNSLSIAAGRLAYVLGLQGPCMAIDTACSSSLVAVHLAVRSLRSHECHIALAGGVNLMLTPAVTIATCKGRMLSFDGRCKTFDAAADGYVRGEGAGIVVLKRLSDAVTSRDPILGVIRGSAVNQDGRSSGLTAPNGAAQEVLLRAALKDAGLPAARIRYVEAHGTGTALGDPIEVRALGDVFAERPKRQPLLVGSVKTNVGHLESAAGIAGLIKAVLVLQHRAVPPHLHFRTPSPHIPWDDLPIAVPTAMTSLEGGGEPLAVGVSSFGFSGTNAHLVLEEATLARRPVRTDRPVHVFTVSAPTESALMELARRSADYLARTDGAADLGDICFTANAGRSHFGERLAITARSTRELEERLSNAAAGRSGDGVHRGSVGATRPKLAFLFTGQGSQYVGMGRQLFETEPTFAATLKRCDQWLRDRLPRPLLSVLYPEPGREEEMTALLAQTQFTQPALFAFEMALASMWQSWGIEPAGVAGHSVGEFVAACVAGVLTLEEGLALVTERSRLMQSLPGGGSMAAIFANEERVARAIAPYADSLAIAAINGPANVVISGAVQPLEAVVGRFEAEGIRCSRLAVSHAFHSPLMEPIIDAFRDAASRVTPRPARLRIVSNVSGCSLAAGQAMDAGYWARHLRQPVRFADSLEALREHGYDMFVEIGPGPVLIGMGQQCLAGNDVSWVPSLRRRGQDLAHVLDALGQLYVRGVPIDWDAHDRPYERRRVLLPTYPFERQQYWVKGVPAVPNRSVPESPVAHPLLGSRVRSPLLEGIVFEARTSAESLPLVAEHVVFGTPVLPATAYAEVVLSAGRAAFGGEGVRVDELTIEGLTIEEPLLFADGEVRIIQTTLAPREDSQAAFQLFSRPEAEAAGEITWARHAFGVVRTGCGEGPRSDSSELDSIRKRCATEIEPAEFYAGFQARGIDYGPTFRSIASISRGPNEAIARLSAAEAVAQERERYIVHPAFLDAAFQVLGAALSNTSVAAQGDLFLPVAIGRLQVTSAVPSEVWSYARLRPVTSDDTLTADLKWFDDEGRTVLEVEGVTVRRARGEVLRRAADRQLMDWLYDVEWQAAKPAASDAMRGAWLLIGGEESTASAVRAHLAERGVPCTAAPEGPLTRESVAQALAAAGAPLAGVVHLVSIGTGEPANVGEVEELEATLCGSLLAVVQALAERNEAAPPRLVVATRGAYAVGAAPWVPRPEQAALWGMGRVVALEHPQLHCTMIDLDPAAPVGDTAWLARELLSTPDETQVAFRGGVRYAARLVRRGRADRGLTVPEGAESFRLATSARGVLDNLCLERCERRQPGPGEVEIRVHASGLNFRDVLNALGMYPGDPGPMGGECAGAVVAVGEGVDTVAVGDDVLCLASGAFSKYVTTPAAAVVRLPEELTYEQGAGIPVTFLTAWYGLHHLAGLKRGDRVLVHSAAGGVGLAAVQIAVRAGAEVYGTAGSEEKREFVRALGARHVFSSRTADFAEPLMALTGGAGVDIVLNSLTGDFIPRSLQVLAPGGRFLEIGKAEIWSSEAVAAANPRASYCPFDLAEVMVRDIRLIAFMFAEVMDAVADGSLKPLPVRTFELQDALSAFRFMAQAKHVGKIVLSHRELLLAESGGAAEFDASASYLVTGGCGGIGLKVAEWLVSRGAKQLVLMGRSAPGEQAHAAIAVLEAAGARVTLAQGDVSREADVRHALDAVEASGFPLRGVFHTAGVLDDGVIAEQEWARFAKVMAPKVRGSVLLDELTRGRRLDQFVLFSSTSAVLGAPGQANYAAANAYMDALAQSRRAQGLPALSINWGAWSEVGMAARLGARDQGRMSERGIGMIAPDQGTRVLGYLLRQPSANAIVMPARWPVLLQAYAAGAEPPMLRVMAREAGARREAGRSVARDAGRDLRSKLNSSTPDQRKDLLISLVRAEVAHVLGFDDGTSLDCGVSFGALGLDSLMALEVRNKLASALGVSLAPSVLFEHPSVGEIANYLCAVTSGQNHDTAPRGLAEYDAHSAVVGAMTDEQVDALLQSLLPESGRRLPDTGTLT